MSIATIATNSSASKLNLVYGHPLGDGAMEEIVLRVQGYLVESKLPPLRKMEWVHFLLHKATAIASY